MRKTILFLMLCAFVGKALATSYTPAAREVNVCDGDTLGLYAFKIPEHGPFSSAAVYRWYPESNLTLTYSTAPWYRASSAVNTNDNGKNIFVLVIDGADTILEKFTIRVRSRYPNTSTEPITVCGGFTWIDGVTYTSSNTTATMRLQSVYGCDSVVHLNLTVNNVSHSFVSAIECDSYTWNGQTYTTTGTYAFKGVNTAGCDSYDTLELTIKHSTSNDIFIDTCIAAGAGAGVVFNNNTYTTTGDYMQSSNNIAGCDSIIRLHLNIRRNSAQTERVETACDSFYYHGEYYITSGYHYVDLVNMAGCDSTVRLNLTIKPSTSSTSSVTVCENGDMYPYNWYGDYYVNSGVYVWNGTGTNGCPRRETLDLTVKHSSVIDTTVTGCDNVTFGNTTYSTTGDPILTLTNVVGCDSVVRLHVRIRNSSVTNISQTACDSYTWNSETYMSSGNKTQHFTNTQGCDSTVILDLTINQSQNDTYNETACDTYQWSPTTGTTYTYINTGTYQWVGTGSQGVNGCPWTKTLNLTVNHSSSLDTTVDNCASVIFMGTTYQVSVNNTITLPLQNAVQCDSIINLHVRVREVSEPTIVTRSACDSFYFEGFGEHYYVTTTESRTFTNAAGCDSIVTLNLTVNHPAEVTIPVTGCNTYYWSRNGRTYTESTTDIIRGGSDVNNCDSIIHLDLTINRSVNSTENVEACGVYTWYGTDYTVSDRYERVTTNTTSQCQDTATLVLTIHQPVYTVSSIAECESFIWHGREYRESTTDVYEYYMDDSACVNADTLHLIIYGVEIPAVKSLVRKGSPESPWMLIYPRHANETDYHYQWYRNGDRIEGANKQYYVLPKENVPEGVLYSVRVSDITVQVCASESSVTLNHSGKDGDGIITVYPNPSRGHFSIQLTGDETEGVATVLTHAGVEMLRFEVRDGWANVANNLPAGSYILQVTTPTGNKLTERLVVL